MREPLVPFAVLGVVLYAVLLAVRPAAPLETIEVPDETIRAIIEQNKQLSGRELTEEEIRTVVADHVDDEVLLREARARGFDQNDSRVRRRLLSVMRTVLDEPVAEPSVAQLEAYYRENSNRLRSAPSVTFVHVYFAWGSERLPPGPAVFIETLEAATEPTELGEFFMGGNRNAKADRQRLVLLFGPAFADAVPALPLSQWSGPIESRQGIHYVRVLERHPPELLPFEATESYLRQEWMFEQRRSIQQKKIEMMREKYRIALPEEYRSENPER